MKNQTDMIVVIVASVLTLGAGIVLFVTKRDPVVLQAPTTVDTSAPQYPAGAVAFGNSLPGGGGSTSGGRGAGGMSAGKAGMMGMMGGGMMGGMGGGKPFGGGAAAMGAPGAGSH